MSNRGGFRGTLTTRGGRGGNYYFQFFSFSEKLTFFHQISEAEVVVVAVADFNSEMQVHQMW